MRFDGLIFDAGDIFYDATQWRRWLADELKRLGVDVSYADVVASWEALLVDVYCGRAAYWDRFERLLEDFALAPAEMANVTKAAREKAVEVQRGRTLFDGVRETLADLHGAGIRLAVLSDTESGQMAVRKTLETFGIEGYFSAVLTSRDIGAAKPASGAFEAAIKALGVPIERCGFVGHDLDELDGACEFGLFTIAYNHPPEARADRRLSHFREIADFVLEGAPHD